MAKKLFIHSGFHKTGSTSIQFYCNKYRNALLLQNLNYPMYIDSNKNRHQSHLQLFKDIGQGFSKSSSNKSQSYSQAIDFLQSIKSESITADSDILLSSENISSLSANSFNLLVELLLSVFNEFDIIFLFALRDQKDLAESLYKNGFRAMVKRQQSILNFLGERRYYFDYKLRFQDHKSIAINSDSRASFLYFNYPTKNSLLPDFFELLGINNRTLPDVASNIIKNSSLDCIDCIAKDLLQFVDCSKNDNSRFNKFASNNPIKTNYRFIESISDSEILELLDWDYSSFIGTPRMKTTHNYTAVDHKAIILAQERLGLFLQ